MKSLGVYFGNIHTFYDLNLFLNPFTPTPAKPKTNYVDLAGGNGTLDLTEALGEVKYNDREFSFTFTVNPSDKMTFDEKVTQVSNALNGLRCKITLDRDSDWYWEGRLSVNEYLQDRNLKQIVIGATVKPYKLKQNKTMAVYSISGTEQTIILKNERMAVVPEITCSNDNTKITFGDAVYTLNAGTHKILDVRLAAGNNILKLSGSGTVAFSYQEGAL